MIGMIAMTGVELAGGLGIGTMIGSAATTLIPEGASVATKVCVGIGAGMTTLATERIVFREFEGYCDDIKTMVKDVKQANETKKLLREAEKAKLEQELITKQQEAIKEEANNLIKTGKKK